MPTSRFYRQVSFAGSALLLVLLFTTMMNAQSDTGAGALRGTVHSADGQPAASATVSVRNADTGYVRELQTNGAGQFDAQALPVGMYFVHAVSGDLKSEEIESVVTVGRTHNMELVLKPGATATVAEATQTQTMVMNTESAIDTRDASTSSSVYLRSIIEAPI